MDTNSPRDGREHLGLMAKEHRRAFGKVYTSQPLASFVLEQAVPKGEALLGPVLDPAVGAGVFLVTALERFANESDLTSQHGRDALLRRVTENLWGIDVDPVAVELTRKSLCAALELALGTPVPSTTFDDNIQVGDFLVDGVQELQRVAGHGWRPRLVVGNPPYVPADRIEADKKAVFRSKFATAHGRLDLYTLFMEQATKVLSGEGTFAFITPDKYLSSVSAAKLRALLTGSGTVVSIGRFSSHRVFEEAATVPCVTVWTASPRLGGLRDLVVLNRLSLADDPARTPRVDESQVIDKARLSASSWNFQRTRHESLEERLVGNHPRLGDVAQRISAGMTTGYNPAFILNAEQAGRLEGELVHPTVRGRDVLAHRILDREEFMLVPYEWQSDGRPVLIELSDYPKTKRWLEKHKTRLRARHCVRVWGKAWWDLHDPVTQPLHRMPKVLVPDVARTNRFASDDGTFVPQHSVYYMTTDRVPPEILTAVLNSRAVEFLVRTRAPVVKDGFSRYRRQFLSDLPVPHVPVDTQAAIHAAVVDQRHDDLADLTNGLFGVETEEIEQALAALDLSRPRSASVVAGTGGVPPEGEAAQV